MTRYNFNKGSIQRFNQERLAKEDIRLLIECVQLAQETAGLSATNTRIEMLLGKLKRMEKQK